MMYELYYYGIKSKSEENLIFVYTNPKILVLIIFFNLK